MSQSFQIYPLRVVPLPTQIEDKIVKIPGDLVADPHLILSWVIEKLDVADCCFLPLVNQGRLFPAHERLS